MSNWTHVAAIFRVDSLRLDNCKLNFTNIFGKELNYNDANEVWSEAEKYPDRFLPCGTEGSLEMSVWENPDPCCVAAYTVSVFGDLRDHDSVEEIINWFDEKCKMLSIRQAVITVDNEWYGTQTKRYTYEEECE